MRQGEGVPWAVRGTGQADLGSLGRRKAWPILRAAGKAVSPADLMEAFLREGLTRSAFREVSLPAGGRPQASHLAAEQGRFRHAAPHFWPF